MQKKLFWACLRASESPACDPPPAAHRHSACRYLCHKLGKLRFRRDLMAIRKPERGCFPDFFGSLGPHTQRKTGNLENSKFSFSGGLSDWSFRISASESHVFRIGRSGIWNLQFFCVFSFFGKKSGVCNFKFLYLRLHGSTTSTTSTS